ncbi:hypothetical protein M378DRAFT_728150 [Amanita muscaria Koide BX008]|uniref:Uncharacterized protein n=1 Tax=Amanita muscaria (strain Koide BX008) TaxID=946122 RepID=A0A0C2WNC7_AMAMK|nr:hypothetical protein M378DRAFT_728150 [Amanita muscaria Koide BX008]
MSTMSSAGASTVSSTSWRTSVKSTSNHTTFPTPTLPKNVKPMTGVPWGWECQPCGNDIHFHMARIFGSPPQPRKQRVNDRGNRKIPNWTQSTSVPPDIKLLSYRFSVTSSMIVFLSFRMIAASFKSLAARASSSMSIACTVDPWRDTDTSCCYPFAIIRINLRLNNIFLMPRNTLYSTEV